MFIEITFSESTDTLVTARRYMADVLGLSFPLGISLIQDRMQLVSYADGAVIIEQGSEVTEYPFIYIINSR